jgi:hypothetical protein
MQAALQANGVCAATDGFRRVTTTGRKPPCSARVVPERQNADEAVTVPKERR